MKALRYLFPALAAVVMVASGRAEIGPVSPVSLGNAINDATRLAERHPGMKVLRVEGVSMLPFFGDGSVLVVKPAPSATLKAGMVVVYTNRFGETVAHRITGGDATGGWEVKGYNNAVADTTRVTDANLVGTVYATIFAMGNRASGELSDALLPERAPIALAAPAR